MLGLRLDTGLPLAEAERSVDPARVSAASSGSAWQPSAPTGTAASPWS